MKKLIFVFCVIFLSCIQTAKAQSKTTQTKAYMLKELRNIMTKGMIKDGSSKVKSEKFADCFTKELGEKLTTEELTLFYKLNNPKVSEASKKKLVEQGEKMGMEEKMKDMGMSCASLLQE